MQKNMISFQVQKKWDVSTSKTNKTAALEGKGYLVWKVTSVCMRWLSGLLTPQNTDCSTFWLKVTQVPEKHRILIRQTENPEFWIWGGHEGVTIFESEMAWSDEPREGAASQDGQRTTPGQQPTAAFANEECWKRQTNF